MKIALTSNNYFFLIFVLFFIFCSNALFAGTKSFSEYSKLFDYPEVKKIISAREIDEFNTITIKENSIVYPGKIFKLHLFVSGINSPEKIKKHTGEFEALVKKARKKLRSNKKMRGLNSYNRAEYLLHFLHNTMLRNKTEEDINVGIGPTLYNKRFNCYKSAVIYNSFLQYFNFKTFFVFVPGHIYSMVLIDGKEIEVETTNRFGFDPYNKGGKKYKRKFDQPNVTIAKKYYSNKEPLSNIALLSGVYYNVSLLYAGRMTLAERPVSPDNYRAAAHALVSEFLNYNDLSSSHRVKARDNDITSNFLTRLYNITRDNIERDPETIDYEARRFLKLFTIKRFKKFSKRQVYNFEVTFSNSLHKIRLKKLAQLKGKRFPASYTIFKRECDLAKKHIKQNQRVLDSAWTRALIDFVALTEKSFRRDSLAGIKRFGKTVIKLFNQDMFKGNNEVAKLKDMVIRNICIEIDNLGIDSINKKKYKKADKILSEGLSFLKNSIRVTDERYFRKIKKHLNVARERQKKLPTKNSLYDRMKSYESLY
ncbi:MAG: hypothetical protein GY754_00465 [bacterium]|nr:hypothetical protein [bacterium]